MDGNGRWARLRSRPHSYGHRAGVKTIRRVLGGCEEIGIEVLSVYAFSTENWTRPRAEVRALMRLFHESMRRELDELHQRGVRILFSGRLEGFSARMQEKITEAVERTSGNRRGVLNVCLNYGGRAELVDAVRRLVAEVASAAAIDEAAIQARLYHPEL